MTIAFDIEAPPLRYDETATIRVGASRVTLDVLLGAFNLGYTAEEIAADFPTVSLAEVYAVIAYYLRHPEQVDPYLQQRREQAEALQRKIESQPGYQEWRDRMVTRMKLRAAERGSKK